MFMWSLLPPNRTPLHGTCRHFVGCSHLDICLLAAGVRCAVLLDTRRAPRGSPPVADVLDALQEEKGRLKDQQHDNGADGGGSGSRGVACLGVLVLEGSVFLVNRALLLHRLEDFFSVESIAERRSRSGVAGATTEEDVAGAAEIGPSSGRTSQLATPVSGSGAGAERQQHGGRQTFALVDVRRSLASPCERSDVLVPRLDAALRSAFGMIVADGADHPPHDVASDTNTRGGSTVAETAAAMGDRTNRREDGSELGPATTHGEGEEGARWLRDWGTKELVLDCEGLRETLAGVGLSGLAGWLLEYPVIYCCPSQVGPHGDADRSGEAGGASAEHVMGNCLAAAPLSVYALSVDLGDQKGSGDSRHLRRDMPSDTIGTCLHAFSFSVPERVCGTADAEGGEEGVQIGLQELVDEFLARLKGRIAGHRRSSSGGGYSGERHKQLVCGLNVSKRTETLDRVAL